jgi:RNA polymerase sigma factor (sigma-70 family)
VSTEIESLYREHRAGLVRLVERQLHDHEDAEDVVQTAFLDAQRALARGTIPRNPHAWLAAIALNAAHRLRRRRVKAEPLLDYAVREASAMAEIRDALASLPRKQRAAVLYRDVLGLSYGETAEQMGTSVDAVTMLLHRGRQRLRKTLGGITIVGLGFWRWSKHGTPQVAAVKGAATVIAAAGLATGGIVAARAIAPIAAHRTAAAPATRSGSLTAGVARTPGDTLALAVGSAPRRHKVVGGSEVGAAPAPTQASVADATPGSVPASTAETAPPPLPSTLPAPTVSLPPLTISTVGATVTATTPVTTVAVTTPTGTTATVTTPITTITVPIP